MAAVTIWFSAAGVLMLGFIPCTILAVRGRAVDRLIALEVASTLAVLTLLAIEQGLERQSFFDLSLALAVLAFPSTLLFARFYHRWLR